MDHNGILASMCFPSFVGFSGGFFQRSEDKDLALIMTQAYNDWHIDEWAASHPGRFIPLAIPPVWDPEALAAEVRRVAAKGCHAITMPELPHIQGLPSYHNVDYWDPFFGPRPTSSVVMCLHIGQGFAAINTAPDAPIDNLIILATQVSALAAQDLCGDRPSRTTPTSKWPGRKPESAGSPSISTAATGTTSTSAGSATTSGTKLPSDIFRDHSLACYVSDPTALKVRADIGVDIIAWECDYPHSDSIFPGAPEFVHARAGDGGLHRCRDRQDHLAEHLSLLRVGALPARTAAPSHRRRAAQKVPRRRHHHPLQARVARAVRARRTSLTARTRPHPVHAGATTSALLPTPVRATRSSRRFPKGGWRSD